MSGAPRLPTAKRAAAAAAALIGGALLPLALAPFAIWPVLLVSAGALFWLLAGVETGKRAFWLGWLFGVGKYGVGASWIYVSIHVYGAAAPPLAAALVALFVAGMALFSGVLGWGFHRLAGRRANLPAAFAFAALWTVSEWLLTWFLTGFPWLFAGYAFLDTPLAGLGPVGGVLLMSFAAVLSAATLVAARRQPAVLAIPAGIWLAAWGLQSITWTQPGAARSVALAQGNLAQETKWTPEGVPLAMARYRDLSATAQDSDILVWPEAAIPSFRHRMAGFVDAVDRGTAGDLVLGIFVRGAATEGDVVYHNGAVSTGGGVYRKRRLVPFGDYVPLESLLRGAIAFFDLPMSRTAPGDQEQPLLHAGGIRLAMAICYEIAYPVAVADHGRGADALVTISNDTWFGASIGPLQHLQIARMRALENGRYLLRATNNGVTAIVDPHGVVVARLPQFEPGVLRGEIRAMAGATPFGQWPHLSTMLALLVSLLAGLVLARGGTEAREPPP